MAWEVEWPVGGSGGWVVSGGGGHFGSGWWRWPVGDGGHFGKTGRTLRQTLSGQMRKYSCTVRRVASLQGMRGECLSLALK